VVRCDFHTHTINDPRDKHVWHTAEELIDKAHSQGVGALAITLHGRQFFPRHLEEYAAEKGILLIPGVEQDIENCHVLLLNFERDAANETRHFHEIASLRSPENYVIAAHPFFPGSICLGDKVMAHTEVFDALEVTGFYHPWWNPNLKALEVAHSLQKTVVGNSDTHTLQQFGSTYSLVHVDAAAYSHADPKQRRNALITAMKQGRVEVHTRPLHAHEMGSIGFKVVGRGYMPWVDYKKSRNQPACD
jgi:predicted metal-dependent phosphoesterase TrpH